MLTKISLSSEWQVIDTAGKYRNNSNIRIQIQNTADSDTVPTEDGMIIKSYESFTIPDDETQYWVKSFFGEGELVVDKITT